MLLALVMTAAAATAAPAEPAPPWPPAMKLEETAKGRLRGHGTEPPAHEREHMAAHLARVAGERLGAHWVDGNMRNIPDHFHAHARPEGGFFGPGGGPR